MWLYVVVISMLMRFLFFLFLSSIVDNTSISCSSLEPIFYPRYVAYVPCGTGQGRSSHLVPRGLVRKNLDVCARIVACIPRRIRNHLREGFWPASSHRQIPHMSARSGSVCKSMCLHDKDGTDAEAAPTAAALGKPRVAWRKSRPVNLFSRSSSLCWTKRVCYRGCWQVKPILGLPRVAFGIKYR
jgi:hypothetical protein